jgi:hypothetical protein
LCGFAAAGLDKLQGGGEAAPAPTEEKEGDEEGGKVPEPVPAAPASYSNNAAPLFAVLGVFAACFGGARVRSFAHM